MDATQPLISPRDLYAHLGTELAPVVVDVRRTTLSADDRLIIAARHPLPDGRWQNELPAERPVVIYCADGRGLSPDVAGALRSAGIKAAYLEGGLAGWTASGLPTRKNLPSEKWVTREHPKIDRIACPWLISRFINPHAQFIYVAPSDVFETAAETGAIPYDMKGVEFGHQGDRCSFDAILRIFDVRDPALEHLATIVRGADTSRPDLAPQCEGLLAISRGLSAIFPDQEMLRHGMVIYDALYTWCRRSPDQSSSRNP
jgi:rhodanese-related sulfurtransferase